MPSRVSGGNRFSTRSKATARWLVETTAVHAAARSEASGSVSAAETPVSHTLWACSTAASSTGKKEQLCAEFQLLCMVRAH